MPVTTTDERFEVTVNETTNAVTVSVPGVTATEDMATQAELDTHAADTTAVHGITDTAALVVTTDPRLSDERTPTNHDILTKHSFPGGTDFLRADGTFQPVSGGGLTESSLGAGLVSRPAGDYVTAYTLGPGLTQFNTPTLSRLTLTPLIVAQTISIDRLALEVSTAVASSVVRLGLYDKNFGLIADFGTVDSTTTGVKEVIVAQTLAPGYYYLAHVSQGGAPTLRCVATSMVSALATSPTIGDHTLRTGFSYIQNSVTGALPNPATPPAVAASNQSAAFVVRFA